MKSVIRRIGQNFSGTMLLAAAVGVVVCTIIILFPTKALSQTSMGSITGQVVDSQGAIIPGATVTVRNIANNGTVVVKSSNSGMYAASALLAGSYTIEVTKGGFQDAEVTAVAVNTGSPSTVNVTMKVGSSNTTVTVNAQAQLLDESSATISAAVPRDISSNLPLPERSAMEAIMLAPGVQGNPESDMGTDSEMPGIYTAPIVPGGNVAVGGGREGSALQLVDGVDLTMIGYPRAGITFSGDDLKQITVQSGGIMPDYGRTGGGVINQESEGGTLQYHGKLAFRHEDPFFEATTYGQGTLTFTSSAGAKTVLPVTQDTHQNMFTGVLGGPVPIPWHRINKNTFFFASFEPLRSGGKAWSRARVPTPAELSGDFSNSDTLLNTTILSSQGYAAAVAAPRVGGLDYQFPLNGNGFPAGARYSSSGSYVAIPNYNLSAQLAQNAFAKYVLSQFPQPSSNSLGTAYVNFYNAQATYATDGTNALTARGAFTTDNRYSIRIDQNLGKSDHAFLRFTDVPVNGTRYNFLGPSTPINPEPLSDIDSLNSVLDYTHTIHANAVNDLRLSFTRMNYLVQPAPSTTTQDWAAKYGLTPSEMGVGFPSLSIDTGGVGSSTGGNDGGVSVNEVYSVGDDYSVVVGNHNLQFGGEWRAMQLDRLPNTGIFGGSYSFSAANTNNGSAGGNATASFILGSINGLTLSTVQEFYYRYKYLAAYAMDTWKVSPRLTFDLGVRYHLEYPRTEKYGLQGSFVPNINGTLNGVAATGGFAFSGTNGLPTGLYPTNYTCFEPRLGFAYLVTPKMTLRGSYDLMHAPMTGVSNTNIPALTPSSLTIGGANGGTNPAWWVNYLTNPVALPSTGIPGTLKGPSPFFSYGTGDLPWISQSNAVPYVENWSLSVQYQLSNSAMVQAAYVGNSSKHLFSMPEPTNIQSLSTADSEIASNYNFSATVSSPYYATTKVPAISSTLPYPQFYNNPILTGWVRESAANYNALYLNGVQRLGAGLSLIGSFSWSKSMDDGSSGTEDGITIDAFGFAYQQSPFSKAGEYSISSYDVPTHVTAAYNWDLPIGKGQLLNLENPVLNAVFGGLHTSGMFNTESGYPAYVVLGSVGYYFSTLPVCSGGTTTNCTTTLTYGSGGNAITAPAGGGHGGIGTFNIRPNIVPGQPLILKNWKQDPFDLTGSGGYLNPAAFSVPGSPGNPQLGNAPRTLGARSPHTIYFDMSGRKDIPLQHSDRTMLTLRADALNIFNHNNYFLNQNGGKATDSTLNSATGLYLPTAGFGICNSGNSTPGRTFAVGASIVF